MPHAFQINDLTKHFNEAFRGRNVLQNANLIRKSLESLINIDGIFSYQKIHHKGNRENINMFLSKVHQAVQMSNMVRDFESRLISRSEERNINLFGYVYPNLPALIREKLNDFKVEDSRPTMPLYLYNRSRNISTAVIKTLQIDPDTGLDAYKFSNYPAIELFIWPSGNDLSWSKEASLMLQPYSSGVVFDSTSIPVTNSEA